MTKKTTKTASKPSASTPSKATSKPAASTPSKAAKSAATTERASADKVGKTQLVDMIATRTDLTKAQSDVVIYTLLEGVVGALKAGQSVGLPGLGTLSVRATAARTGVRPGTSEKIQIAAGKKVSFKVASTLKGTL